MLTNTGSNPYSRSKLDTLSESDSEYGDSGLHSSDLTPPSYHDSDAESESSSVASLPRLPSSRRGSYSGLKRKREGEESMDCQYTLTPPPSQGEEDKKESGGFFSGFDLEACLSEDPAVSVS